MSEKTVKALQNVPPNQVTRNRIPTETSVRMQHGKLTKWVLTRFWKVCNLLSGAPAAYFTLQTLMRFSRFALRMSHYARFLWIPTVHLRYELSSIAHACPTLSVSLQPIFWMWKIFVIITRVLDKYSPWKLYYSVPLISITKVATYSLSGSCQVTDSFCFFCQKFVKEASIPTITLEKPPYFLTLLNRMRQKAPIETSSNSARICTTPLQLK